MPKIFENEYTFLSANGGTQIHVHEWLPEGEPRAVIQIAHGIAEYIDRYAPFASFLAENGVAVVGNDHLGHGKSILGEIDLGFFAYKDGWQTVVDDIEQLRKLTAEKFPGKPYFLFGHSMGSFLTRTHLIRFPGVPLSGAILCGTGQTPPPLVTVAKRMCLSAINNYGARYRSTSINKLCFGSFNRDFAPERTEYDWLSRDEAQVDAYIADELCGFLPTVGLFYDMMEGLQFISKPKNLRSMNKALPTFFISGSMDPVGDRGKGVRRVFGMFVKAGMGNVSMKIYTGGRHEILNEINREEVFSDVLEWVHSKL